MFNYVGLFRMTPVARENLEKTHSRGTSRRSTRSWSSRAARSTVSSRSWAPGSTLGIFTYPDLEAAFRALGKIAKLEIFETETFPAEDVEVFFKVLRLADEFGSLTREPRSEAAPGRLPASRRRAADPRGRGHGSMRCATCTVMAPSRRSSTSVRRSASISSRRRRWYAACCSSWPLSSSRCRAVNRPCRNA